MISHMQPAPRFSDDEARALARDLFGVTAGARPLPSERDQNFLLETGSGPEFVLKIASAAEAREVLEGQNGVLEHLARRAPSLRCPRVRPTASGEPIGIVRRPDGTVHFVRLLTHVPGHLLADASPHTPDLLHSLGAFFGRLDLALAGFSHPALQRELQWDLKHASAVVARHLGHLGGPDQRALVEHFHRRFRERIEPVLPGLRASVIHNDGNDYNVLVTGVRSRGGEVTGVVDFGDLVETQTVFELAVCAAYAILGKSDPVAAAAQVVGGYHRANPLTEQELELLYDLIAMRLCTSVSISALQKKRDPENAYLTVSEGPAWAALERLAQLSPRLFYYAFRDACGLPACPRTTAVVRWLEANAADLGPVVGPDARAGNYVTFDLSAGGSDSVGVADPADVPRFTEALFAHMGRARVRVGVGRYDEARRSYTTERYRPAGTEIDEWRTVHLGMDLFMQPGSPVFAPLDGMVHSFANNADPQDYGPTIILRHVLGDAGEFFTLYGHLSKESLEGLKIGKPVAKGSRIGSVGDSAVNGHWPPHLHFQIIMDLLDQSGNFPGVCAARDRALWLSLCPDPNLILQIPGLSRPSRGRSPEEIVEARKRHLGGNLSIAYESPLKIVQGWMQHLYDHLGREFLDTVNNVAHVGHCHPAVVRAAQQQMAVLNTNTRYLHDNLVEYAERLCATLPTPLRVCYFVCSGSEANEMALRMVRTHTKASDVIVLDGAYHGNTATLLEISPYKFDGPGGAGAPPRVHKVVMPDRYRGPYRDPREAGRRYAEHVQEALDRISRTGRRVGAFICESMLSCGGQIVLPPGYLADAYRYVREAGGVCIADEIQVGFGRVGSHFWGFETQGVVPDIVTMGKPIGNGHPLAAVVTTPEVAASFANGMEYFNTFGGNPVSCAVGLAVLDVIEREGLQRNALTVGAYLKDALRCLMAAHPLIGDVRGEGLFVGVELVRDPQMLEPAGVEASYVAERMKQLGILTGIDGPYRNVLKIKPPMVFTKADADRFTDTLDRVLSEPRLKALRTAQEP
jgi:4-aminobutyrate aminotransferase-like enzyme/Ser/Thr protein kinase RdoA (MazF antagonist)